MTEANTGPAAAGDPRPAAVTFVTPEHFTLQGSSAGAVTAAATLGVLVRYIGAQMAIPLYPQQPPAEPRKE